MKLVLYDTETQGVVKRNLPPEAHGQPRLVSVAAVLWDGDVEVACLSTLVQPAGFTIPAEATAIHGITTERALAEGRPLRDVLADFATLTSQADVLGGHNYDFDWTIMAGEMRRAGMDDRQALDRPEFCTMLAATPVCHLPGKWGTFKWPKLAEVYKIAFGEELVGAHDALTDLRATKRVFDWLVKVKGVKLPLSRATGKEVVA